MLLLLLLLMAVTGAHAQSVGVRASSQVCQRGCELAYMSNGLGPLTVESYGSDNSSASDQAQIYTNRLKKLFRDDVLVAAYWHADITNPRKDYSGHNRDETAVSGVPEPVCTKQGCSYGLDGVRHAFAIPASVYTNGKAYVTRLVANNTTTTGPGNQTLIGSTDDRGLAITLSNYNLAFANAWAAGVGRANVWNSGAGSKKLLLSSTVLGVNVGTNDSKDPSAIFYNGSPTGAPTPGPMGIRYASSTLGVGTLLFGGAGLLNDWFAGLENATLVFNRSLTAAEHAAVALLLSEYATKVQDSPAIPAASVSRVSQVVCLGDSITAGYNVDVPWCSPKLLTGLGEPISIHNAGVSGDTAAGMAVRAIPAVHPYFGKAASHNTVAIFGGTNDAYLNSFGDHTAIFRAIPYAITSAAKQLHGLGWKVIALPMIARTKLDSAKDVTINADYRRLCPKFADACVSDTDPLLHGDGAAGTNKVDASVDFAADSASSHTWDGAHPSGAGQRALATYFQYAYEWLHYRSTAAAPTRITSAYAIRAQDTYNVASPSQSAPLKIMLPNCIGFPLGWKTRIVNPQSASLVTVQSATSAQKISGIDRSSSGTPLTVPAHGSLLLSFVPGPSTTGGCYWHV